MITTLFATKGGPTPIDEILATTFAVSGATYLLIIVGIIVFYLMNGGTRAINRPLRRQALDALEGNWGTAVIFTIVYAVLAAICGYSLQFLFAGNNALSSGGSFIGGLILMPISFAYIIGFLGLKRGVVPQAGDLFKHYNKRIFLTMLLKSVYMCLWLLLFIVPGIVKYYSYAMTEYILKDNPELSNNAAIEASMAMMKGNKKRLFLLDLSFTGWSILCVLTFGLGLILLYPYWYTARAAFYEELKGEVNI